MQTIKKIAFIKNLEEDIRTEFSTFEKEVQSKWCDLSLPDPNELYFVCPYFEDIDYFFENGIVRILDSAIRKCKKYSPELELNISWYEICGNYPDIFDFLCKPYSDTFQAVASKNKANLAQIKKNLSIPTTSSYSIISTDFTFALAFSVFQAISNAISEVENNHSAWNNALIPQQQMHSRLASLWKQNFEKIFMACISNENIHVQQKILACICESFGISYEQYCVQKDSIEVQREIEAYKAETDKKHNNLKLQRAKYVDELQKKITQLDKTIEECGFAFWGAKGARKRAAQEEKQELEKELHITKSKAPLPKEYIFTTFYIPAGKAILKESEKDGWFKANDGWIFEFDTTSNLYNILSPSGSEICSLDRKFTLTYGKYRKIGARLENIMYDDKSYDIYFSLYELDD